MHQIFPFCTNEINKGNTSSRHLSKPKPALLNLINKLNNYSNEKNNQNNQNMLDCKDRNIEYLYENCLTKLSLSLFHLRKLLSTFLKECKQTYFSSYFNENIKDIKKTWKGIKSIMFLKSKNLYSFIYSEP